MNRNTKAFENFAVVATIDPDAYGTGEQLSDAVDMRNQESIVGIVLLGEITATGTIDAKFVSSATSGGTYTDVTGKAATQLTAAGTDSDKQVLINLRAEQLAEGHRFVKLSVTAGTAGADYAAAVLGFNVRYGPDATSDLASVDELVG